jgi:putative ABC transport system permease protein
MTLPLELRGALPRPGPIARLRALSSDLVPQLIFGMRTATEAVAHNTLRAALTSLGILFGVASVIAMLAIGKGAEQEILEQMRLLGTNNIIIAPLVVQKEEKAKDEGDNQPKRFSPGLTWQDAQSLGTMIPHVSAASPEIVVQTLITREGQRRSGKLVGVDTSYFESLNLLITEGGHFTPAHLATAAPVAIIGSGVKTRFFTKEAPLGRRIKVGDGWLTVVGVLEDRPASQETRQRLGIRDANMDVYVPLQTMLLRYRNRAQITARDVESASRGGGNVTIVESGGGGSESEETKARQAERKNTQQLDRVIVRVGDARMVTAVAEIARRMLERRHNAVVDFEITVPELLLKQEQRTKTIFNVVLGAIASISLIVGGIGIMNIMLATVLERIREIGVRRAMGATRREILMQFLCEATIISVAGGVAGIIVGVGLSYGIERLAHIHTIVSAVSVMVAFGVSLAVGLVFGIVPAYRAAQQDPVVCLRYE